VDAALSAIIPPIAALAAQLDLLSVRPVKHHAAPAALARLARRRVVRRARHLDALFLQLGNRGVEILRLETEVKALHRFGPVRQLEYRIAELQVGDLHATGRGVLKIFLEAEALFVKSDRALEVAHMDRDVIDSLNMLL